jgi:hypothetical protein
MHTSIHSPHCTCAQCVESMSTRLFAKAALLEVSHKTGNREIRISEVAVRWTACLQALEQVGEAEEARNGADAGEEAQMPLLV